MILNLTRGEKEFLIKNQDSMTLEELGELFGCSFKDVYDTYEHMFLTGEYKKIYKFQHDKYVEKLKETRGW